MTDREPGDPQGRRLWALDHRLCGANPETDDLLTLAWQLYHELCDVKDSPPSADFHAEMMQRQKQRAGNDERE